MTIYAQGDVLVRPIANIPPSAKPTEPDGDRVVLAYGEVTGHAHALRADRVMRFRDEQTGAWDGDGGAVYLRVAEGGADLVHEEHGTHALPAGDYEIRRQREYHPAENRLVAD